MGLWSWVKCPLTREQYVQIALTVIAVALLLASAVAVSQTLYRHAAVRTQVLILTEIDCDAFATWAQAQAMLDAIEGDPFGLDGDSDGEACEALR